MITKKNQKGVGLVEVLVALLLLAVGVLGFTALQLRAMNATLEATDRTFAMNLARDLAERIRVNKTALSDYQTAINDKASETDCIGSTQAYAPDCDAEKMANYDANEILDKAAIRGQTIVMNTCDGSNLTCIYVAWGDTSISKTDVSECMVAGTYVAASKCLVMEAF